MYVSGSSDGSIKVWDGASNKCSLSFNRAHEGEEICSVLFSKNGKVHCSFIGFNVMWGVGTRVFLLTVRLVERQGLCCQVVGTVHVEMFDCLHWSGSNRQAAVSQHSSVQPHRRLRYYHCVNNDITFFVVLKYFTIIILLNSVFFPDEKTISLCCWDSRNSERQRLLNLGQSWLEFRLCNYGSSRDKFIAP